MNVLVVLVEGMACSASVERNQFCGVSVVEHHLPSASAAVTSPGLPEERGGPSEPPGAVRHWAVQPSSNNEQ